MEYVEYDNPNKWDKFWKPQYTLVVKSKDNVRGYVIQLNRDIPLLNPSKENKKITSFTVNNMTYETLAQESKIINVRDYEVPEGERDFMLDCNSQNYFTSYNETLNSKIVIYSCERIVDYNAIAYNNKFKIYYIDSNTKHLLKSYITINSGDLKFLMSPSKETLFMNVGYYGRPICSTSSKGGNYEIFSLKQKRFLDLSDNQKSQLYMDD